jgi:hypothetical protein
MSSELAAKEHDATDARIEEIGASVKSDLCRYAAAAAWCFFVHVLSN